MPIPLLLQGVVVLSKPSVPLSSKTFKLTWFNKRNKFIRIDIKESIIMCAISEILSKGSKIHILPQTRNSETMEDLHSHCFTSDDKCEVETKIDAIGGL
jgi:hypothetical protein